MLEKTDEARQATDEQVRSSIADATTVVMRLLDAHPDMTSAVKIVKGGGYAVQVVVEFDKERR